MGAFQPNDTAAQKSVLGKLIDIRRRMSAVQGLRPVVIWNQPVAIRRITALVEPPRSSGVENEPLDTEPNGQGLHKRR